ncbi:MAG TPA: response regulator [Candidatus Nanoarchaeia archaeon]|nr:response regulator [Candidatus Nanoarchaeia archaeon]
MTKILLVEDDINLRDIYSARFMAEGYEVLTSSDGEEALATAVKARPDLIILDVMMPKISGFDVLDILRSTPETKDTKIIMMTALSQDSDRARGEALGVTKYLVKSQVTLEDVVASAKEAIGA